MGLLDDLLGGLAGQATGGRPQPRPTEAGAGGSGTSQALMALMPIVLACAFSRNLRIAPMTSSLEPSARFERMNGSIVAYSFSSPPKDLKMAKLTASIGMIERIVV